MPFQSVRSYWGRKVSFTVLSWRGRCSGGGGRDLGIVSWKQDEASAVENKVPSLYYTLYYSPAPFPLDPVLLSRWRKRGEKKKENLSRAVSRRAAFELSECSGVQVFRLANTWPAGVFTSSMTFLWRRGCEKIVSQWVLIKLYTFKHFLSLMKNMKESTVPFWGVFSLLKSRSIKGNFPHMTSQIEKWIYMKLNHWSYFYSYPSLGKAKLTFVSSILFVE